MQKQKGFASIILIVTVLLIAGVGGAYYFGYDHGFEKVAKDQKDEIATPSSVEESSETANWKTYTNKQHGFEIKYPPNTTMRDTFDPRSNMGTSYLVDFELPKVEGSYAFPHFLSVEVFDNPRSLSGKEYFSAKYREAAVNAMSQDIPGPGSVEKEEELILGTQAAYAVTLSTVISAPRQETYIAMGDKVFEIQFEIDEANDPQVREHTQIFKQILSTFKFTN